MKAAYARYTLRFKEPAITSRSTMTVKDTYFIKLWDEADPSHFGIGECALFKGLGADDVPNYEATLAHLCRCIGEDSPCDISSYSSIRFGLDTALLAYQNGNPFTPLPSPFTEGRESIIINGLIWMGDAEVMTRRITEKLEKGFSCIKLKIGGIDFNRELEILDKLRCAFSPERLTIRLDANGAFSPDDAMERLNRLAVLDIHSIEQPIRQGQWDKMAYLCANTPIPIALDEELIGIDSLIDKRKMLTYIAPQYIILKPALCGGLSGATEWMQIAEQKNIGWWVTSALESNIGLNALAQWVACLDVDMPQGLGTGQLYENNIPSPLTLDGERLSYHADKQWELPDLNWIEG